MQVVYHWARGVPFKDICELTDVLEGAIVRTIVRLDETCRLQPFCSCCSLGLICIMCTHVLEGAIVRTIVRLDDTCRSEPLAAAHLCLVADRRSLYQQ